MQHSQPAFPGMELDENKDDNNFLEKVMDQPTLPDEFIPRLLVYTDGASSPNGVGGWAWWAGDGQYNSGAEVDTTNQRMELTAAVEVMYTFSQPLMIVSDSAYVVNCFNDKWYKKWLTNNWKNGKVKNRDLWELALERYLEDTDLYHFKHVKGHSGVYGNEMADQLAVAAKKSLMNH